MTHPILTQIKEAIGVDSENLGFDSELLLLINSSAASLVQLGISELDIIIEVDTVYPIFRNTTIGALVVLYIQLWVKQVFDPTASETISKILEKTTDELEGRIAHEIEAIESITNILLNSCFSEWTGDDPDDWAVTGETGPGAEVSEVGDGENHGDTGTGYCNLYVVDSDADTVEISQDVLSAGVIYRGSIDINHALDGGLLITENDREILHLPDLWDWDPAAPSPPMGIHEFAFLATGTKFAIMTNRGGSGDAITIGCVVLYRIE